ncbi:hypothetical protein PROVRETT_07547 [Providencia rettgeri DSM 1131]|nr:hypothetical protein PROVRETT_07547 [Providencia rettgeri DSM 1131]
MPPSCNSNYFENNFLQIFNNLFFVFSFVGKNLLICLYIW